MKATSVSSASVQPPPRRVTREPLAVSVSHRAVEPEPPAHIASKVAWVPQRDLEQPEWLLAGQRLGAIGRCSQWWIGDWLRYGVSKWGEKYALAARVTGYDAASLRNMAWVASRFDPSLRSDKLAWSHHVLLAPLDHSAQEYWLDRAVRERLSVADLRLALRSTRNAQSESPSACDAPSTSLGRTDAVVCPHCGHEVEVSRK